MYFSRVPESAASAVSEAPAPVAAHCDTVAACLVFDNPYGTGRRTPSTDVGSVLSDVSTVTSTTGEGEGDEECPWSYSHSHSHVGSVSSHSSVSPPGLSLSRGLPHAPRGTGSGSGSHMHHRGGPSPSSPVSTPPPGLAPRGGASGSSGSMLPHPPGLPPPKGPRRPGSGHRDTREEEEGAWVMGCVYAECCG
jgi:hypothetical protein